MAPLAGPRDSERLQQTVVVASARLSHGSVRSPCAFVANDGINLLPVGLLATELLDQRGHFGPHEIRQPFALAGGDGYRGRAFTAFASSDHPARVIAEIFRLN